MAHHEPLKALGHIDWAGVTGVTGDDLEPFLSTTFARAQTVIDSIPPLPASAGALQQGSSGRARSHTESSLPTQPTDPAERTGREHAHTTATVGAGPDAAAAAAAAADAQAEQLRKEWKEVKVPPKDNPMDISVFKLAGKDGRGAWFARRSLHGGVAFDRFRLGLEREFGETMKNSRGPGTGNVRGIGAERRAEHVVCDGVGKAEVWLLSAQFPGPTTPRDFLTLLLSRASGGGGDGEGKSPRQFMVVSRPCDHPECQPRNGFIRGNYESVEVIREVPVQKSLQSARSSTDLKGEEPQLPSRPAQDGDEIEREKSGSVHRLPDAEVEDDSAAKAGNETEMAIEWLMVTRSDPGGSVPRFMVEKGTPGGIVSDAGRFIKWLDSKTTEDLKELPADNSKEVVAENDESETPTSRQDPLPADRLDEPPSNADLSSTQEDLQPSGFYNMIAGALGAVSSRLPGFTTSTSGVHTDSDTSYSDSEESERSFASAQEPEPEPEVLTEVAAASGENAAGAGAENASLHSSKSDGSSSKAAASQHEKALKKLQERQKKVEEKMARQQERSAQGKQAQGDDALAKLKEKHDKEVARQEEHYRKEVKKLEEKRVKDEKKAEEKRRKHQEKEERENVSMQLEKTMVERDVALKQVEILKEQVGLLQTQNTRLAAQLDKEAVADGVVKEQLS